MTYSAEGYIHRAEECARLASLTSDEMIGAELLKLRQVYLQIAGRLRGLPPEAGPLDLAKD